MCLRKQPDPLLCGKPACSTDQASFIPCFLVKDLIHYIYSMASIIHVKEQDRERLYKQFEKKMRKE